MNIKKEVERVTGGSDCLYLNDIEINPLAVKAVMINEVVPTDPLQDFYGEDDADYLKTTIPLFQRAGAAVSYIGDILQMGIYITNAVKTPKNQYTIEKSKVQMATEDIVIMLNIIRA